MGRRTQPFRPMTGPDGTREWDEVQPPPARGGPRTRKCWVPGCPPPVFVRHRIPAKPPALREAWLR